MTFNRGHQCVFVMIDKDTNGICMEPLKSRKSKCIVEACNTCHRRLTECGFTAELVRLDDEISKDLITAIENNNPDCQIASPGDHRTNPAENAVKHAEAHFKSVRACADPSFDPKDWDQLLLQTELTLNLSRPSKINPNVSACTMTDGHCDHCRNPMVPAATQVVVHEHPAKRGTWSDCGVDGFHMQPAMKHCRNFQCFIPSTEAFRRSKTVDFFPMCCDLPALAPLNHLAAVLADLKDALHQMHTTNVFNTSSAEFIEAMKDLQNALSVAHQPKVANTPTAPPDSASKGAQTSKGEPATRPVHTDGTIICKAFGDEHFEGTIVGCNPIMKWCKIHHVDGDSEEMTHQEVKQHCKPSQTFGTKSQQLLHDFKRGTAAKLTKRKWHAHLHQRQRSQRVKHEVNACRLRAPQAKVRKGEALAAQLKHLACKAGCVWDNDLKKWMDLEALLQHPNPAACERWQRSSTKEHGNIFQGCGETEGKNVCTWIYRHETPQGEKVTHPRTVVDCRPEKVDNPH